MIEQITVSTCCKADVHTYEDGNYCAKCHKMCVLMTVPHSFETEVPGGDFTGATEGDR
jgi:hypothetical protein